MRIKIDRVRVKNFRSLQSVETKLGNVTLLLGANNSGKTSFLRALTIALNSERKFISKDDLFIDRNGDLPSDPRIIIDIEIKPEVAYTFTDAWAQLFGTDIQLNEHNEEFFAYRTIVDFSLQQSEAKIKRYLIVDWESDTSETQEISAVMSAVPMYFIDAQRDLQDDLKYANSYFGRLASQIEYDEEQKRNIEVQLSDLNQQSVDRSSVLSHLKASLTELNRTVQSSGGGVEITPFPRRIRDLHKGLSVNFRDGDSESFSLEYHGMGTRSWASLLGYKAFISWIKKDADDQSTMLHPILALEEPEAHLHPNAQRQVYSQLERVEGQKIISTHSPYIAPLASVQDLRLFYKDRDSTYIADLVELVSTLNQKQLHRLKNEIIYSRGELLFSRIVIFFEGQTEEYTLPIFAQCYWNCPTYEKGITLIRTGDSYMVFVKLLEIIRIPWVIFSDYDTDSVRSKVDMVASEIGVDPAGIAEDQRFILLSNSIEKYLIESGYRDHLVDALHSFTEPNYANEHHRIAKREEREKEKQQLTDLPDDDLLRRVDNWKSKIGPIWAKSITEHADEDKRIPSKIKDLFTIVDQSLQL